LHISKEKNINFKQHLETKQFK